MIFSLEEVEVGHDRITQTTALQENLDAALHENSTLEAEVAENKAEVEVLKTKVAGLEKNIITIQKQLKDLFVNQEKSSSTKTADFPLAKSLKDEIFETKNIVMGIQEDKFNKKTTAKNSEKLFRKNVNAINLEIENVRDQVQNSINNYEELLISMNDIKKSIRENPNTLIRITEKGA